MRRRAKDQRRMHISVRYFASIFLEGIGRWDPKSS